jgi:heterodisulfide reductase subunit C
MVSLDEIIKELNKVRLKYDNFRNYQEGHAVLLYKVIELGRAIKLENHPDQIKEEAVQVAVTALRFLTDCF